MVQETFGYRMVKDWFVSKGLEPFSFQEETWQHIANSESGLVNAPTGCGKTFSVFLGAIINFINDHPQDYKKLKHNGLQLLWITPLRALAKDLGRAMEEVITDLGMSWKVGIRNGDTDTAERQRQKRQMPEVLLTTPESLHLLIALKGYRELFSTLKIIAVDEWHELLGSKRGVQVELAISHLVRSREWGVGSQEIGGSREIVGSQESGVRSQESKQSTNDYRLSTGSSPLPTPDSRLSLWGISATIGNLEEAKDVLYRALHRFDPENIRMVIPQTIFQRTSQLTLPAPKTRIIYMV